MNQAIDRLNETKFQAELTESNQLIRKDKIPGLAKALINAGVDPDKAYVVKFMPEQQENIYFVLSNSNKMHIVEIARNNQADARIELLDVERFTFGATKKLKRKIAIAQNLISSD